jgi:hypothetical protein
MSNYFVIRLSDGAIIDVHVWADTVPVLPPMYSASEHIYVLDPINGAGVNNGWTYVDGQFVAPSVIPSVLPAVLPSIAELQAQMAQIQAHLSALVANGSSGLTGEVALQV